MSEDTQSKITVDECGVRHDEIEREELPVEVLIVGGGPAGLACAYKLAQMFKESGKDPEEIVLIEKADELGKHSLSGAVMNPKGIAELIPDYLEQGMPVESKVSADSFVYLSESGQIKSPIHPPGTNNSGNYVVSLNKFVGWLGAKVEELGVMVLTGTGGYELLIEDYKVVGVRTADMGRNPDGSPGDNFEPGSLIKAKCTVLAEGVRGSLTKQAYHKLSIGAGKNPHNYLTGVKEIWEVPEGRIKAGQVIHTFGFPQPNNEFGGGFIYGMSDTKVAIGFAAALGSPDPQNDPHMKFQRYKTHPFVKKILEGGKLQRYGAKAIAEGGYWALPKFHHDGMLVIGESAGLLNAQQLKGIHLGIKSGIMAAETIHECLDRDDFSEDALAGYSARFDKSWVRDELYRVRNFHAGFEDGLFMGIVHTAFQTITGGRGLFDKRPAHADHEWVKKRDEYTKKKQRVQFDNEYLFDKLTDVFNSGTMHEEHQPSHLVISDTDICNTRCTVEYGNPCQHFCPAQVYNMVDDEANPGKLKLQLTPSNCVHCKTCDIADPYQIINWVVPEGGGPNYVEM